MLIHFHIYIDSALNRFPSVVIMLSHCNLQAEYLFIFLFKIAEALTDITVIIIAVVISATLGSLITILFGVCCIRKQKHKHNKMEISG